MSSAAPSDAARDDGGVAALFARVAGAARVILPINDAARDEANASPAFYCVHSLSGAGGTDFLHLAKLMPEAKFYGIQAPTAKMHDPSFGGSVESLAEFYVDVLTKFQPSGRFFLGGWSAGVIIGLEIAQKLRARGRVVSLFAAIDAVPENTRLGLPNWHPLYLLELGANSLAWFVNDVLMTKGSLRSLLQRGFAKVTAQAKVLRPNWRGNREGGTESVEAFMDLSRYPAHERSFMSRLYAALFAYTPRKYAGTAVAYEATKKPLLHLPQVGRIWSALAPRSTVVRVKGTHLSILRPGDVEALAKDLEKRIVEIAAQTPAQIAAAENTESTSLERKSA
jgi:thioesterase domain-containing protein